jgi:ferredoxin
MPKVIINDEVYEAAEGDLLLDVARRNGAHIGFMCNGNGICTTCECRVQAGTENLSDLTPAEKAWIGPSRREQGYRLGCQAGVGTGEVKIITRVEELRRSFVGTFQPAAERDSQEDNIAGFLSKLTEVTINHVVRAPLGLYESVNRVGLVRFLFPWTDLQKWIDDGSHIVDEQLKRDDYTINVDGGDATKGWDDFTQINGVGFFSNSRLHRAGITTYVELAAATDEDLAAKANTRVARVQEQKWREQAAALAAKKATTVTG